MICRNCAGPLSGVPALCPRCGHPILEEDRTFRFSFEGDTIEFSNNATQTFPTLTTLVNFNGTDGSEPVGGLLADSLGDLYATTFFGGQAQGGVGTVSEIVRSGTTYAATPKVLANFVNSLPGPNTGLIADASGDLFGALSQGGAFSDGAVFEISKTGTGYASTPTVLASFNSTDGSRPNGLVADAAGDLFGTTQGGGKNSDGTVFEIARTGTSYASAPATLTTAGRPYSRATTAP